MTTVNIQNFPGVPAVATTPGLSNALVLLTSDTVSAVSGGSVQWGFYQSGQPAITAKSVVAMDYRQEWALSDFPVEEGGFETFDKVALPFDVRFRFSADSFAARTALLQSIAAIAGTTQLLDGVTPEIVYNDLNVTHYDYHRTAQSGLGLLQVDVWCLRVNQIATMSQTGGSPTATASTDYTASQPSGANPQIGGVVQPTTPTATQTDNASSAPAVSTAYSP